MSKARHPENIFSNGPTSLNPDSIKDEIVTLKLGLKLNAILIAIPTGISLTFVPGLIEASQQPDAGSFVVHALGGAIFASMSIPSVKNILEGRRRLEQANYNRRLNEIADANGMGPKFW